MTAANKASTRHAWRTDIVALSRKRVTNKTPHRVYRSARNFPSNSRAAARSGLHRSAGWADKGRSRYKEGYTAVNQPADYYEILQISPNAEPETIHRVFRLLAQRYHPDNHETGNAQKFRQLHDAYVVLTDAVK